MNLIYTLGTNIGRKIAQTELPTLPRRGYEEHIDPYTEAPAPFYRMMVVDNPNSLLGSTAYVMGAPLTMGGDAIATIRTAPKILYNFGADLLNAGISKHNNNAYRIKNNIPSEKRVERSVMQPATYMGPAPSEGVERSVMQPATYMGPAVSEGAVAETPTVVTPVRKTTASDAKSLIAGTLNAMLKSGQLAAKPSMAKSLINLYNKIK